MTSASTFLGCRSRWVPGTRRVQPLSRVKSQAARSSCTLGARRSRPASGRRAAQSLAGQCVAFRVELHIASNDVMGRGQHDRVGVDSVEDRLIGQKSRSGLLAVNARSGAFLGTELRSARSASHDPSIRPWKPCSPCREVHPVRQGVRGHAQVCRAGHVHLVTPRHTCGPGRPRSARPGPSR